MYYQNLIHTWKARIKKGFIYAIGYYIDDISVTIDTKFDLQKDDFGRSTQFHSRMHLHFNSNQIF